jgi:hypothetical protein
VSGVGPPRGVFSGLSWDVAVWNDTLNSSQVLALPESNNAFVEGFGGPFVLRRRGLASYAVILLDADYRSGLMACTTLQNLA